MSVEQVSRNTYARIAQSDRIHDGWGANQGFLTTKEGSLVVDTGFTRPAAEALLREVRRRSPSSPLLLVINTHDHSDHVFGNCIFEESSAMTISHANCRNRLVELGKERMRGYRRFDRKLNVALKGLEISPARITYSTELEFTLGGAALKLIHPMAGAHTAGDTMVLVPDEKVLFAGDVVWAGYHPNLEDANLDGWVKTLDEISRMGIDQIVPGHGPVADRSCVPPLARYLRRFDDGLTKLVDERVPKKEIANQLDLPGTEGWRLEMIVQRNVDILYESYRRRRSRKS